MHRLLPVVLTAMLAVGSTSAQGPVFSDASFNNFFRVVSTATNATTGRNQPWPPTTPPSYATAPGVPAGTRAWTWTPKERFQGGHNPFGTGNYVTIMGFTQTVFVGSAIPASSFPTTTETYQFETGIAPVEPQPLFNQAFQHTSNGAAPDIVNIPMAALSVPQSSSSIFEHSFQLTTPIPIQNVEMLLYVVYRGGEYRDDPMGGQTLAADWKGGGYLWNPAHYYGFATPPGPNRAVTFAGTEEFRGKIGLIIDEPYLVATGFHGNRYHTPPLSNERYLGLTATFSCDYAQGTFAVATGNQPSLWFDFEGGSRYGTGFGWFTVFLNMGPWFPVAIPTPFGNLLLSPGDPLLGLLSSVQFPLGATGEFTNGSSTPFTIPLLGPGVIGQWLKFQGICANLDPAGIRDIAFTNSSSMLLNF